MATREISLHSTNTIPIPAHKYAQENSTFHQFLQPPRDNRPIIPFISPNISPIFAVSMCWQSEYCADEPGVRVWLQVGA